MDHLLNALGGWTLPAAVLLADAIQVFRVHQFASEEARQRAIRWLSVLLPCAWTVLYLIWESPVTLVFVGAVAQGLMLPFLAVLALLLNHRHTDPALRTGVLWRIGLWFSAACMVAVGIYQVVTTFK